MKKIKVKALIGLTLIVLTAALSLAAYAAFLVPFGLLAAALTICAAFGILLSFTM